MNANVTAVKHADIRGKEQLYLKIDDGEDIHIMNIGQATFDKITEMSKRQELKKPKEPIAQAPKKG